MKIIIPTINTGIGDLIMTLPMLKNIEANKKLQGILVLNQKNYEIILKYSFLDLRKFEIIFEKNISSLNFWIKLRKKSKIILSLTIGFKPLILWKFLGFKIFSKPLIFKNKFYNFLINSIGIPKNHDVINNLKILEEFYEKNKKIKKEKIIFYPELKIKSKKEKIIFVHPGFDGNSKIPRDWGIENWIDLVKKLSKLKKDFFIKIIIGPGFEKKFKNYYLKLEKKLNNVKILETNFENLLKELSKGEILINTDSGIGHLAGALGLKTITLFGPADEKQTGVFSDKAITIRAKGSNPCYSQGIWVRSCKDLGGLKNINTNEVIERFYLI